MKNLELNGTGLRELDRYEERNSNGGVAWIIPVIVGIAITQIIMHWDHFKNGLRGEPELIENQESRRPVIF